MSKITDVLGQKFNRLLVVEHVGVRTKSRVHYWRAVCDCGNEVFATANNLKTGAVKSCGCWQREVAKTAGSRTRTHGMSNTSEYAIWDSMIARCHNEKSKDYCNYGARGISVCDRWKNSFENFYADMGPRPARMSIDRVDNEIGYSPENCRWATALVQTRNQRSNVNITFNGKTQCLTAWADEIGINPITLQSRLSRGNWTVEDALSTPVRTRKKKCKDSANQTVIKAEGVTAEPTQKQE